MSRGGDQHPQSRKSRVTRVTVVTGFLGSGKTTLVKRLVSWLEANNQRVMVFVNDLAEYNFDATALGVTEAKAQGGEQQEQRRPKKKVLQLQNGCICCTLGDDLVLTLMDVFEKEKEKEKEVSTSTSSPWLDRIVIETSGVSDPYPICASIRSLRAKLSCRKLELDAVVCLVDVAGFQDMFLRSLAMKNQIQAADVVLLNKVDLATDDKQINQVERTVQKMLCPFGETETETKPEAEAEGGRSGCRTMKCVRANVDAGLLMDTDLTMTSSVSVGEGGFAWKQQWRQEKPLFSIADHPYQSCSFVLSEAEEEKKKDKNRKNKDKVVLLDMAKFHLFLERLPKTIIRAKGFVRFSCLPTMVFEFHLVGQTYQANQMPWEDVAHLDTCSTSLVLIGSSINERDLKEKFKQCISLSNSSSVPEPSSVPGFDLDSDTRHEEAEAGAGAGGARRFREMIGQDKRFSLLRPEGLSAADSVVALTLRGHYGRFGTLSAGLVEAANRELTVRLSRHSLLVLTGNDKQGVSTLFVDVCGGLADVSRWQSALQRETFVVLSNLVDPQQQALYQVEADEGKVE